jgi:hypothetical protein
MSDNKDKNLNLKIMSKKIKFQFLGETFELPSNSVQYDKYNNNEPYIYMRAKNVASVIKQYVKKNMETESQYGLLPLFIVVVHQLM